MSDLHYLSATEAKRLFTSRELSPVELLEAVITRTDEVEGSINALTERMHDEAHAAARESEQRYAKGYGRSTGSRCCSRRSSRSPAGRSRRAACWRRATSRT